MERDEANPLDQRLVNVGPTDSERDELKPLPGISPRPFGHSSTSDVLRNSSSTPRFSSPSMKDFLLSPTATLSNLMRQTTLLQGRRVALFAAVLNVMNAIMGSGILALPSVMAENGWLLYVGLQLALMVAVDFSLHLLVAACKAQGVISYEEWRSFLIKSGMSREKVAQLLELFYRLDESR